MAEMDASGNVNKSYGWKLGGTWGTDPLFMKTSEEYYFYHNDHLGTPQKMTDPSGAVAWSATYSSFGKANVEPDSTVVNNLRYPGQYYDWETGLHYNWYRYYDQNLGRYLKIDPIGFLGGDSNLFAYVLNDPVNLLDPWGLMMPGDTRNPSKAYLHSFGAEVDRRLNSPQTEAVLSKIAETLADAAITFLLGREIIIIVPEETDPLVFPFPAEVEASQTESLCK